IAWNEEVTLEATRRAHHARERGPDEGLAIRMPRDARGGQPLGSRIGIALALYPERELDAAREIDLILHEEIRPIEVDIGRDERLRHAVLPLVAREAIPPAPDELVSCGRLPRVLDVEIESLQSLVEEVLVPARGAIQIGLEAQARPAAERPRPAPEDVLAGVFALGRAIDLATVGIAPQSEEVSRRPPVESPSPAEHARGIADVHARVGLARVAIEIL